MLGDFVKGAPPAELDAAVRAAILRHRAIDRYTDHHPVVVSSRALVSPERRRFAGIMIDIFYDHFLARRWHDYYPVPLPTFTRGIYDVLLPQRSVLPPRLQRMLPWMAADDWLASYADIHAVEASLNGIARRFRFPERAGNLASGIVELQKNYGELERHFIAFFPELRAFVAAHNPEL